MVQVPFAIAETGLERIPWYDYVWGAFVALISALYMLHRREYTEEMKLVKESIQQILATIKEDRNYAMEERREIWATVKAQQAAINIDSRHIIENMKNIELAASKEFVRKADLDGLINRLYGKLDEIQRTVAKP